MTPLAKQDTKETCKYIYEGPLNKTPRRPANIDDGPLNKNNKLLIKIKL